MVNRTARRPSRIAVLSIHTSPLDQPGTGDAGGMNVYVVETAMRLARRGVAVDIFTRATRSDLPETVDMAPGVRVRHVVAGPYGGLRKEDLPAQLCAVTSGVLRLGAELPEDGYDLVHSHYWLSGQVGWLVADRWQVPLVHTMHTMAKVKNEALAAGDTPEPEVRVIGEEQVARAARVLVANTVQEAVELETFYSVDPARIVVAHPGVDLDVFSPADGRQAARRRLDIDPAAVMLLFVGRIQPLKAPDVTLRAAAEMLRLDPTLRERLLVVVCGGPSGSGLQRPEALVTLAAELGITDNVRFVPPQPREALADYYRAADLVTVPSYSESFGLVAVEAQACGTPVVAAAVGGLTTAVANNVSGILIDGHDPVVWGERMLTHLGCAGCVARMRAGSRRHAHLFSWDRTVDDLLEAYELALSVPHTDS